MLAVSSDRSTFSYQYYLIIQVSTLGFSHCDKKCSYFSIRILEICIK